MIDRLDWSSGIAHGPLQAPIDNSVLFGLDRRGPNVRLRVGPARPGGEGTSFLPVLSPPVALFFSNHRRKSLHCEGTEWPRRDPNKIPIRCKGRENVFYMAIELQSADYITSISSSESILTLIDRLAYNTRKYQRLDQDAHTVNGLTRSPGTFNCFHSVVSVQGEPH